MKILKDINKKLAYNLEYLFDNAMHFRKGENMADSIITKYISKMTDGTDDNSKRSIQVYSIYLPLGAFVHVLYTIFFFALDVKILAFFNIGSFVVWMLSTFLMRRHILVASILCIVEVIVHAFLCVHYIGWGFGVQFFIILIPIIMIVSVRNKFVIIVIDVLSLIIFFLLYLYSQTVNIEQFTSNLIMIITYNFNIIIGISISSFVVAYYKIISENAEKKVTETNKKLDNVTTSLRKYLPLQLVNSIIEGKQKVAISSERKKLTIFFSDIQGFTEITDCMEPEDLSTMLNEYITEMTKIAHKWDGTIDKFIGDAMMVLFGTSPSADDSDSAVRCVKMAMEMQEKMKVLKDKWFRSGIDTLLEIRIGINTGITAVGSFGTEDRLSYTAIGGQVNLASRLESLAKPGGILISHATWGLVNDEIECTQRKDRVKVKGINKKILVYDVVMSTEE